ncbi:MAG: hypothetical protein K6G89_02830 [Clostridia bacterium]|nr:hypothetical protein [Clostridia bacterium]
MADTVKFDKGNIRMVAHRGVSGLETENTCLSFVAAGSRSYFGIETDIHVTPDGGFVVIHDNMTGRVAEVNVDVEKTPLPELMNIKLKDREDGAVRNDIRLPVLDDYVKICKRYGKVCVLEIKSPFGRDNLKKVLEAVSSRDYAANVIYISFHLENLLILRDLAGEDAKLQFLCGELNDDLIDVLVKNRIDIDIHYPTLLAHPEYMEKFRKGGLEVNCWTCDDPKDALKLKALGVDYITTNILE